MSVISKYVFTGPGLFQGQVDFVTNTPTTQPAFPEQISTASNMLTLFRPGGEMMVEIGPQLNTVSVLKQIDALFSSAGAATRASPIRAMMVPWLAVPYFSQNPVAHQPFDMLVDVNFDFVAETPWFCSNLQGSIEFFLFFALDQHKHLKARADGAWFRFSGGGICSGTISSILDNIVQKALAQFVQPTLDKLVAPVSGVPFKEIYLMPRDGTRVTGTHLLNATLSATLGVVPNF